MAELSSQAEMLKHLVAQFKLKNEDGAARYMEGNAFSLDDSGFGKY